ncbi:LysR family transcriptional regulator [Acinetobacter sp. SwsAc6]|uniref:LysR family transcriptional regulator n=1 Tax=Acinetobacter TaxID=469 RepID=UPI000D131A92|nr:MULTISPECIES: LysR family transcriptional regulator [Acinetobacter]NWK75617.1 LysR family transcriptional regulator [Acinetobacter sp. SwsAc6]QCO22278.1 LysR family transcriptional regulator [Acinetobacter cumulans]
MNTVHSKNTIDMSSFYRIDMNLYPLFVAIYEQQNISKAAQLICITQSAASHALQRLRTHLKDDLFVRTGSKMLPTPFAEQIYPDIKDALFCIQKISNQNQKFDSSQLQTLKIAVHDEIEPLIFPKLVAHFQQSQFNIQFSSIKLDRKNIVADLASQQVDFVIDLEQNFGDKIQFHSLQQDHFVACSQQLSMNKAEYISAEHIGVSSRRTGTLVEDIFLNRKHLSRNIRLRCQHYSTALQILEMQPQAVLTIPQNILSHLQIHPCLNIFEVPVELPLMSLGIFWHKDVEMNARHNFLRGEIFKIFA